jgi:hypothetical protein
MRPCAITGSSSSRESCRILGSSSATARGVNARRISARSAAWRGGSWKISQSSG